MYAISNHLPGLATNFLGLYSISGEKASWRQSALRVSPGIPLKPVLTNILCKSSTGANSMSQLYFEPVLGLSYNLMCFFFVFFRCPEFQEWLTNSRQWNVLQIPRYLYLVSKNFFARIPPIDFHRRRHPLKAMCHALPLCASTHLGE
jgi:hypothetical protein